MASERWKVVEVVDVIRMVHPTCNVLIMGYAYVRKAHKGLNVIDVKPIIMVSLRMVAG